MSENNSSPHKSVKWLLPQHVNQTIQSSLSINQPIKLVNQMTNFKCNNCNLFLFLILLVQPTNLLADYTWTANVLFVDVVLDMNLAHCNMHGYHDVASFYRYNFWHFLSHFRVDINFVPFKDVFYKLQIIVPFKDKGLSGKSEHIYI